MNGYSLERLFRSATLGLLLSNLPGAVFSETNTSGLFGEEPPQIVVNQGEAKLIAEFGDPQPCFLSIDDRLAVTIGEIRKASFETYGELLVWDLSEGRLAHRIEMPARIAALAGSRGEGRLVVVGGPVNKDFNPPFVAVVDLHEGEVVAQLPTLHEGGGSCALRLTRDGRFAVMADPVEYDPSTKSYSYRYLAYALPGPGESPREPRLVDENLWNQLDPLSSENPSAKVSAPNWIRHLGDVDDSFALAVDERGTAIFRTDTWEKVIDLGEFSPPWQDWSPSTDGRHLVSWRRDLTGGLVLWDLKSFRVTSFDAPSFFAGIAPAFSEDNRFLRYVRSAPNSEQFAVISRDLASGREEIVHEWTVEPFEHHYDASVQGRFSENGRHLVVSNANGGGTRVSWEQDGESSITEMAVPFAHVLFVSDDGTKAGFGEKRSGRDYDEEYAAFVLDLESRKILRKWNVKTAGHPPHFGGAIDSSSDALVFNHHTTGASLGYYGGDAVTISGDRLFQIPGFQVSVDQEPTERYGHAWSVGFAKPRGGGKELATVYSNFGRFVTFDPKEGQIIHEYRWPDFTSFVHGAKRGIPLSTRVVAREGGRAFLPLRNGGIRVIDLDAGGRVIHRADLWSLPGNGWFAVTPEGYYASSVGSERHVFFRVGDEMYSFEQFDAYLNRPDLVAAALGADRAEIAALQRAFRRRLAALDKGMVAESLHTAAVPELTLVDRLPLTLDADEIFLNFKAQAIAGRKLRGLSLFANGVRLDPGTLGSLSEKTEASGTVSVALAPGENLVELAVTDETGTSSVLLGVRVHRTAIGKEPDLYLVMIGVSDYADDGFDLTYPAKDARDLGAALKEAETGFREVHLREILDGDATRKNILAARGFLRASRPGDRVVVFVAGHGMLDENYRYFFGATDIDFENPAERGVSYEELESLFDGVPARERLLLMDTCQAGSVDVALLEALEKGEAGLPETITVASNEGLRAAAAITPETRIEGQRFVEELFSNLNRDTGATVISASGGLEFALEAASWNNGVFTYAVIDTIRNRAAHDRDEDGTMRVSELAAAVSDSVSEYTGGHQHPNARSVNLAIDFPVVRSETARRVETPVKFLERYLSMSSCDLRHADTPLERILTFFAEPVDYFGNRMTRPEIAADMESYNRTYDERIYQIDGTPRVSISDGGGVVTIEYEMKFRAGYFEETTINVPGEGPQKTNTRAYRNGNLRMRMKIRRVGDEWLIEALGTR